MANRWLAHMKKTMRKMKIKKTYKKGMGLKQVIAQAKLTYRKGKRGGAEDDKVSYPPQQVRKVGRGDGEEEEEEVALSEEGGRRRTRRKSRR